MKRLSVAVALMLAAAGPAHAQLVVHDPTSYASLLRQAKTALDQLNELKAQIQEAKRLYDGFNIASGAGAFAQFLDAPELRAFVPDVEKLVAAAGGDFAGLGDIGREAAAIREANRLYMAAPDDALGLDLERQGDRAARDLALGQEAAEVGAERLTGLRDLADKLDTAPNVRAVLDLHTRFAAEQAHTLNDQLRLQGLAMAQDAEARLADQRDRERAAAEATARLDLYRRAFQ